MVARKEWLVLLSFRNLEVQVRNDAQRKLEKKTQLSVSFIFLFFPQMEKGCEVST